MAKKIGKLGHRGRGSSALTRQRVLEEALGLLDREGITSLNMRQLAAHLGVTPMALYNHVSDKDDLLRGVAALVVDNVSYGSDSDDWREEIRTCFRALRNACLAHPGIVRVVESAKALPSSIFRPMEIALAALRRAGLEAEDAFRAYCLLMSFTMGQISYETRGPYPAADPAEASRQGQLSAATFPASAAAVLAMADRDWDNDAAFEFGLSTILAGLNNFARAKATSKRRSRTTRASKD